MTAVEITGPVDPPIIAPTVYTKAAWANAWVERSGLYCDTLTRSALSSLSSISNASFAFEYGRILDSAATDYADIAPLDVLDHWVKVSWLSHSTEYDYTAANEAARLVPGVSIGTRVLQLDDLHIYQLDFTDSLDPGSWTDMGAAPEGISENWYGIFTDQSRDDTELETGGIISGTQSLRAMGVEWLLTKHQIYESVIADVAGVDDSVIRVREAIPFNDYTGTKQTSIQAGGNQSTIPANLTQPIARSVQVFDKTMAVNPRRWNARDIVDYILAFFTHHDLPTQTVTWELDLASNDILSWFEPNNFEVHGKTVFEAISSLINRKRGLTWWVDVDESADKFQIKAESMLTGVLGSVNGKNIPANRMQVELSHSILGDSHVRQNSRVISKQETYDQVEVQGSRRGLFTILQIGDQLINGWEAADETAYASATDYNRMHDSRLKKVYSHFLLDPAWDGAGFGVLDDDGILTTGTGFYFWRPGIRIEDYVPVDDEELTSDYLRGQLRPEAVIDRSGTFSSITRLSYDAYLESDDNSGIKFNCRLMAMKDQPGIIIDSNGGPNHLIAKGTFTETTKSDYRPVIDYRDIYVFAYLTFPERVYRVHPVPVTPTERFDHFTRLVIRAGDRLYLDQCITGAGGAYAAAYDLTPPTSPFRDDREQLEAIARMAYEWYDEDRRRIENTYGIITGQLRLGALITTDQFGESVNSVISRVTHRFPNNTTQIQTEYAAVDFSERLA